MTGFLAIGDTQPFSYRMQRTSNLDHNCALPSAHFYFLPPYITFTTYPPGPLYHGKCAFSGYVRFWFGKFLGTLKYRNQLLLLILPFPTLNFLLLNGRISSSSWFVITDIPVDSYCQGLACTFSSYVKGLWPVICFGPKTLNEATKTRKQIFSHKVWLFRGSLWPQLRLLAIFLMVVFGICFGMVATGDYITPKIGSKK